MTDPARYYADLLQSITDDDVYRTLRLLFDHIGQDSKISIDDMAIQLFGEHTQSTERKVRRCLAVIVDEYEVPVGAISGQSGRWLIANEDERQRVGVELINRGRETIKRGEKIMRAVLPAKQPERVQQRGLWG